MDDLFVESGQRVEIAGIYFYVDNPDPSKIACWPTPAERSRRFNRGDIVPKIKSRTYGDARYLLKVPLKIANVL